MSPVIKCPPRRPNPNPFKTITTNGAIQKKIDAKYTLRPTLSLLINKFNEESRDGSTPLVLTACTNAVKLISLPFFF